MIEFGNTLRTARENKGLGIGQLAELTRLAPTTIRDLEAENFERIAAPIYGRGFVKLYCEAVGLDPKPLICEFMEIYNGNRDDVIKERPVAGTAESRTEPPVQVPPDPEPTAAEPVPAPPSDLFQQAAPPPVPEEVEVQPAQEPSLSRYASPMRQTRTTTAFDPHAYLRLGVLGAGALALLVLLLFGIRSVYRATTTTSDRGDVTVLPAPADEPVSETPPPVQNATRTPQKIPPLYLD